MKRTMSAASFLFFLLLGCWICVAQTPGRSPERDPRAISAVEQALAALGGKNANLQVRTIVIRGTLRIEGEQAPSSFLWEDDLSGRLPEFRKEILSADQAHVFVSGHGTPAHVTGGRHAQVGLQHALAVPPLNMPGLALARELKDQSYSFELIGDNTGLIHVRTFWDVVSGSSFAQQDWYFDSNTHSPVRVEYFLPSTQRAGSAPASMEFSDFRLISGVAIPHKIVGHGPDQRSRTFTVTSVQTNVNIESAEFELKGGQQ